MKKKININKLNKDLKKKRDSILNAILANKKVYIKDTGIEAKVTDFNQWFRKSSRSSIDISVELIGTPTIQALDKMRYFTIDKSDNNGIVVVRVCGEVRLNNLSTNPFDTKASRILHGT